MGRYGEKMNKQQLINLDIGTILEYTKDNVHLIEVKFTKNSTLIIADLCFIENHNESVGGNTDFRMIPEVEAENYTLASKEIRRYFE